MHKCPGRQKTTSGAVLAVLSCVGDVRERMHCQEGVWNAKQWFALDFEEAAKGAKCKGHSKAAAPRPPALAGLSCALSAAPSVPLVRVAFQRAHSRALQVHAGICCWGSRQVRAL